MSGYRVQPLMNRVVTGGYCIGCGACAAMPGSPLVMRLAGDGLYRPELADGRGEDPAGPDLGAVCPFYSTVDEDVLAGEQFGDAPGHDPRIGYYRGLYAGAVTDPDQRAVSSSGGIVTWLLAKLITTGRVDGVVHVARSPDDAEGALFRYRVACDAAGVHAGAKSRYHPVEMSRVASYLRTQPGHYAIVGVPCFIKGVRLLARQDAALGARIACTIALFCGHMKSTGFAEYLGWQLGLPPGRLTDIDFRAKRSDAPANRYGVTATGAGPNGPVQRHAPAKALHGTDWGLGLFKPQACDFCDDVAGETADIACGDAWLPAYVGDSRGTSVVIVRPDWLDGLLQAGRASGELALEPVAPDDIVASQDASYRHRHDGLAYRLAQRDRRGQWRPPKRIAPAVHHLDRRTRSVVRLRQVLAQLSHPAYAAARRLRWRGLVRLAIFPPALAYYVVRAGWRRGLARALRG